LVTDLPEPEEIRREAHRTREDDERQQDEYDQGSKDLSCGRAIGTRHQAEIRR
jgi:hypothetical protein